MNSCAVNCRSCPGGSGRRAQVGALLMVILLAGALPARAQNASNSYWQSQNIYQIITDRFYDGDPSNDNADGNYDPAGHSGTSVHGGDFKGIEQKLDYLKALGVTAIWISPVVVNAHGEFHGYSGSDFYHVDPHWGTLADLQHLVQAAHARGILVIDDIIVNHGADLIYSADSGYANFLAPPAGYTLKYRSSKMFAAPFDTYNSSYSTNNGLTNYFHNDGAIQDFGNQTQVELGELSGLDDFRTESPYVRAQMAAIYEYWIGQAGFDGFRIDTTKHVEMGFWQSWCPAVHAYAAAQGLTNFFMFGEVYDGSESKCGSYTGTMGGGAFKQDSVLDYPLYFMVNSVFASASGNTKQVEDHYHAVDANYDPSAQKRLVTFLDNHDQPRFLSIGGATTDRLQVALAFLYTSRGIPCLYYGTEQGFNGATDPYDREDMFAGQFKDGPPNIDSFNMTHPLFLRVGQLNNFRRLYPALSLGEHVNLWNDPNGPGLFAYARRFAIGTGTTQEVFVVFNTATGAQTLTNRPTTFAAGSRIVNLFDTNEVLTILDGPQTPPITVPGTTAKIFVAQSDWKPLDPVVAGVLPAHEASNVPPNSPLVLQFSQPMDTNSVQAAFSVSPSVSGAFAWSPAQDTMTFTPGGSGFAANSTVVVRLSNSAVDAVSGNALFAPYQMQFHTGSGPADVTAPTVSLLAPSNGAVISGKLLISGAAADNVGVRTVEVALDHGPWIAATGTNPWSLSLNSSNFLNGPHVVSARASDSSGNLSATNSIGVRFFNVPGSYLERISGGNPSDVTDCSGNTWVKDTAYTFGGFGYSGGTGGYVANTISGICAQAQSLYQREHYSTSSSGVLYQFDCPAGVYEITLLEAETWWSSAGKREFNLFIQGRQVLTNFDIYAAAGGMNLPVRLVFTNAVTNSELQVLFTPVLDNTRVSGIQVRKLADVFSDSDGIPDWWRLAWFGHAQGSATDRSRGSDDADGDGVSNLTEFLANTRPLDPASFPTLPAFALGPVAVSGAEVQLSCLTATNWTYQLQRRPSLSAASPWTNLGPAVSGTGAACQWTDFVATDAARFYRVQAR